MKGLLLLITGLLLIATIHLKAQNTAYIEKAVEGINTDDYRLFKRQWGLIGRVLLRKKKLSNVFAPYRHRYGELQIDTIIFTSKYRATVELFHPSHPHKRSFLACNLNEKGKLEGFGFGWPTMVYPLQKKHQFAFDAQNIEQRIDSIVHARSSTTPPNQFNGAIMVMADDTVLYKKCKGSTYGHDNEKINDSTRFLLASVSKQFTAVGILQLMERGLLNLHDPVCKHLPSFPYPEVTIEHLLTHTSGIPEYFPLLEKYWNHTKFVTNQDILSLLIAHDEESHFKANTSFKYSNTGYVILSLIIEEVSGQAYAGFLDSAIFKPLGMRHTSVYHRRKAGNTLKNYALGTVYSAESEAYISPDSTAQYGYVSYMDCITGDDGVSSTILDLRKWNDALSQHKLLRPETSSMMHTSHVLEDGRTTDYGYGVMLKKGADIHNIVFHSGSWPGYRCIMARFDDKPLQIIILTNNYYPYCQSLLDEIAAGVLYAE